MNRNSIFDITAYPLFVVVVLFISIITILGIVGLQFMIHDNPNRFDDSVLSFEFLSFVLLSTLPLTVVMYLLTVFRSSSKNPKKEKTDSIPSKKKSHSQRKGQWLINHIRYDKGTFFNPVDIERILWNMADEDFDKIMGGYNT